ncbi:MAG: D-glycero-beta-D-manno-heptose-7-phosphate kinase [Nitrospinota bacterium]
MRERIKDIIASLKGHRIIVVGDLILDEYIWGSLERISPEAPVGIIESKSENLALGGAANVANNLIALGLNVDIFGVIGKDQKGKELTKLLKKRGVVIDGIVEDESRHTTNKIRVIANHQQILRIDREKRDDLSAAVRKKLLKAVSSKMNKVDGIILSDYGKGVVTEEFVKELVEVAKKHNKKIIADPKGSDYSKYKGVAIVTPNKKEASEAAGIKIDSEKSLKEAAQKILKMFKGEALLITRGDEGMSLFKKDMSLAHISTVAKEVYDVSGAGDTVISVFAGLFFNGLDMVEAVEIANIAAGIEVGKIGTAVVTGSEIIERIESGGVEEKGRIVDLAEIKQIVARARNMGKKIVFTNGCFDLLHVGHIKYLAQAKSYGDILIIGMNSDSSVRKLKGPKRPLIGEEERGALLTALNSVDYVVIFSEPTPDKLIKEIMPDVLVKGGDYAIDEVVGRDIVEAHGGRVELVPVVKGMSTSGLVQKIMDKYKE